MISQPYRLFAAALLCLVPLTAHAQSFTPKEILFAGAPQFSQADMLAVSGLHPGQPIDSAGINAGAQALADSGFFSGISFAYSGVTLTYKLVPMDKANLLPARFDNFLWWTDDQLNAELHHRHPLYTGAVPQAGKLLDQITADLTSMLTEKGVTATVLATTTPATDAFVYTITAPPIRVHAVQITGLDPSLDKYEDGVRTAYTGRDYSGLDTPPLFSKDTLLALQDEGYLDAAVSNFQHSAPTIAPDQITVDLSDSVTAGSQYRVSSVDWPGSPQLSTADFNKTVKLKAGEPASGSASAQTRSILGSAYLKQGYIVAKISMDAKLDRTAHTAAYIFRVTPGGQYTIHSMTLDGVTDKQRQDFMKAWKMQNGGVYDATYVHTFLLSNAKDLHSLDGYSLAYKETINDATRVVDLHVQIKKDDSLR